VPAYDPAIVLFPPRPGFVIAGAIHFGPAVVVAPFFVSWGWMHPYFEWRTHAIFFDYVALVANLGQSCLLRSSFRSSVGAFGTAGRTA